MDRSDPKRSHVADFTPAKPEVTARPEPVDTPTQEQDAPRPEALDDQPTLQPDEADAVEQAHFELLERETTQPVTPGPHSAEPSHTEGPTADFPDAHLPVAAPTRHAFEPAPFAVPQPTDRPLPVVPQRAPEPEPVSPTEQTVYDESAPPAPGSVTREHPPRYFASAAAPTEPEPAIPFDFTEAEPPHDRVPNVAPAVPIEAADMGAFPRQPEPTAQPGIEAEPHWQSDASGPPAARSSEAISHAPSEPAQVETIAEPAAPPPLPIETEPLPPPTPPPARDPAHWELRADRHREPSAFTAAPPPPLADAGFAPAPSARRDWRALMRRAASVALIAFAGWFIAVLVLIVAYRFINPPFSMLMAQQFLTGTPVDNRWVPIEEISPNLSRAVIVAEDGRFCSHFGVDFVEAANALRRSTDAYPRGASTITMQVAKNLFLVPAKSYLRKLVEIPLTFAIELVWPKQRILEIYLNIVEWGPGVFGAEAASRSHFGRPASDLSARQAAQLAAVLPNPIVRNAGRPGPRTARKASVIQSRAAASRQASACVDVRR